MTHAQLEGREAFLDGHCESENPYAYGTCDHDDWDQGWRNAADAFAGLEAEND